MSIFKFKSCTTKSQIEAVALAIHKRGRYCIIAKLTCFLDDSEPILAIAVRNQIGTSEMISVPMQVIAYAERHGVQWLYWRRDRHPLEMRRVELSTFRLNGYLQQDGETYFPLAAMEPVPWKQWKWAEMVVRLTPEANESKSDLNAPKQLALAFEGVTNEL